MNRLISLEELATRLNCHSRTILRNLHKQNIPHSRVGKQLRFDEAEVLEHIKQAPNEQPKRKVKTRRVSELGASEFTGVLS